MVTILYSAGKKVLGFSKVIGKQGKFSIADNWGEYLFYLLLALGFFISTSSGSAFISYIIIFLCGMMGGRLWFTMKKNLRVAWAMILTGFLVGFVLGSFYGDKKVIIILYVVGIGLSYFLHNRGLIKTTEY